MEGNTIPIRTNATIPITDLVRARLTEGRVALPVEGTAYARLDHINAVPSLPGGSGYSITRLQAIDSLLTRIANSRMEELTPDVAEDPVEYQEAVLEEAARLIARDIETGGYRYGVPSEGFLLDMTA